MRATAFTLQVSARFLDAQRALPLVTSSVRFVDGLSIATRWLFPVVAFRQIWLSLHSFYQHLHNRCPVFYDESVGGRVSGDGAVG